MKKSLLLTTTLAIILSTPQLFSQNCDINGTANPTTITCGQSSVLTSFGSSTGQMVLDENFNSGGFGSGWGSTPGATSFNNPCSSNGVDGTTHAWMDNNTSVPRTLTSAPYNLTTATAGVSICFDLLFATQGQNAPCEGPDEPDEGVFLQYSTDGGNTWIDIHYFDPNGGNDPQLTNWNNWCFALPAGAITSSTIIRWHQTADSGADYDHWGIDNVQIFQNDINAEVEWLHDGYSYGVGQAGGDNPTPVSPITTTTYTAQITTGAGDVCTADVTVIVLDPVYDVNVVAAPSTICAGDCATISGDAQIVLDPGGIETYDNSEVSILTGLPSLSEIANLLLPCVSFSGCNCPDGSSVSFGQSCPAVFDATLDMNINVTTLNGTSLPTSSIESVCIDFAQMTSGDFSNYELNLFCPDGTSIRLANVGDLAGTTLSNVCFDMNATNSVSSGASPYTGSWLPAEPFTNLNGCTANGVYTLQFSATYDWSSGAPSNIPFGVLNGWNITFDDPPIYAPVDISWSPTTGLSDPSSVNTDACPNSSTDYELTLSNGTPGCATYTETVSITVDPCGGCVPPDEIINPLNTCAPGSVILSDAIGAGSDPATLTYHASQTDAQNDASPIATSVSATGSYWVRAEDPADPTCFNVYEIVVTIDPLDDASFTLTDYCEGTANSATGIATSGGTFSFNPSPEVGVTIDPTTGEISNGVNGTTYTVEYTTSGTCPSTSTETVSVLGLSYSVNVLDENCGADDGEINLTPIGGSPTYTYSIDGGTTTQGAASFTGLSAGNYSILITDGNGCTATGNESVANVGGPTIDDITPTNETCVGACDGSITVTVSGGSGTYSYQWYDNLGNPIGIDANTIDNLCDGDYSVEVSDASLPCSSTEFETLTVPTVADPSFTLTDFCAGSANSATNIATSGGTFDFNPNPMDGATIDASTGEITNAVGGTTYSVEYTTPGACPESSIETVDAQVCCNIVLDTTSTVAPSCGQADGEINVQAVGGDGNYTYSLDGGAFVASNSFTALSAGNYQIEVQDGSGSCSDVINVQLSDLNAPVITAVNVVNPLCNGNATGEIEVLANGGSGTLYFEIVNGTPVANNTTGIFTGLSAANYTVNVTDDNGCLVTSSGLIVEPSVVTIATQSTDVTCFGANDGTIDVVGGGGTPTYNYSIDNGVTWNSNANFTGLSAQNYQVIVEDANGCQSVVEDVLIAENGTLVINSVVTDETCFNACDGSITLNVAGGTGPYDYSYNGGSQVASNSISDLCAGIHNYIVTDANGCSSNGNDTIIPAVRINPSITSITDDGCSDICDGEIVVTSNTGVNYTTNGVSNATGVFTDLCEGIYTISVEDLNGCVETTQGIVGTIPQTVADFTHFPNPVTIFESEVNFTNTSSNASEFVWVISDDYGYYETYSSENLEHEFPSDTGEYLVCLTAINPAGCQDEHCMVLVVEDDIVIFVPNTFTPDGDEFNQTFRAYVNGVDVYAFDFLIFNRWGELIWENHDPNEGWDGTYNGELVQEGAYVWKIVVKDVEVDFRKTYSGHVTILK